MYQCSKHGWVSKIEPCPKCQPQQSTVTGTQTTGEQFNITTSFEKYFAKKVILDESPTNGDSYVYVNDNNQRTYDDFKESDLIDGAKKHYKKVVLMLCTTHIKNGDKLKECCIDGKERIVDHFETVLPYGVYVFKKEEGKDEEWINAYQAWRILGPISKDAKWIKAGDRIKETDVQFYIGIVHNDSGLITTEDKFVEWHAEKKAMIKCNCCETFK